ncbi:MAG: metal ABC transporter permease [archaeon GB-1845-036]|nr:metal ABC transporter permease [Candidatus Culexmicrobium thermophilum]
MLEQLMINPFIFRAIIGIVLASFSASTMGTFIVVRGISFLTAEVAHAALGGAALGIFLQAVGLLPNVNPFIIATIFAIGVTIITGIASREGTRKKLETAIGAAFAISMAMAVTLMGIIPSERLPEIWGYLIGDLLLLTYDDLLLLATITAIITVLTTIFLREFLYISFDIEGAEALGLNSKIYNYLMLILASLSIVVETKTVGSIIVYAFMILPAAIASQAKIDITSIMIYSLLISIFVGLIGLTFSLILNLPPSGIIGLIFSGIYISVSILKKE